MEQKIQELTEKIYKEGVEKGEAKAKDIVSEAESRAAAIVKEAKAQAEKLVADARKQAEDLKRNAESELKNSGAQAIASIKNKIVNLISAKVLDDSVSKTLSDPGTLKEFVSAAIHNWKMGSGDSPNLEVLLPAAKQSELQSSFNAAAVQALGAGVTVKFAADLKAGFRIGPSDGTYKISLTDEDFKEFFKEYLRPKTRAYLFGE
ncbi:ATP synthase subunit E [Fibrobacteres bacterium R8-0-B4]